MGAFIEPRQHGREEGPSAEAGDRSSAKAGGAEQKFCGGLHGSVSLMVRMVSKKLS